VGGGGANQHGKGANEPRGSNPCPRGGRRKNAKTVLEVRLAQECPSFYRAFLDGEYKSIRAAAEAAGLVKPGHDPLARLKNYWRRATAAARAEFLRWAGADP
jgi:hypothetical protein